MKPIAPIRFSLPLTFRRFQPRLPGFAIAAILFALPASVRPATISMGNLLLSVNEFTGSSTAPTYLAEYTTTGTRVQILANVPIPGAPTGPTTDQARDLVYGADGAVYLYNGTFDPFLARLNPVGGTWTQTTFAGWSTVNNGSYGGVAALDNFIYVSDMRTGGTGDLPQGVVRFDINGGPTVRFAEGIQPNDIYIGRDLVLYALDGAGSPRSTVYRYDPVTFASLGTIPVAFADHRGVASAPDGTIYLADWSGVIRRYNSSGTLLDSLTVPGANFSDIDIAPNGSIALGTGFSGEVVITDVTLDSFTRFRATDSTSGGDVFVSWALPPVSIPESGGTLLLLCGSLCGLATLGRRSIL